MSRLHREAWSPSRQHRSPACTASPITHARRYRLRRPAGCGWPWPPALSARVAGPAGRPGAISPVHGQRDLDRHLHAAADHDQVDVLDIALDRVALHRLRQSPARGTARQPSSRDAGRCASAKWQAQRPRGRAASGAEAPRGGRVENGRYPAVLPGPAEDTGPCRTRCAARRKCVPCARWRSLTMTEIPVEVYPLGARGSAPVLLRGQRDRALNPAAPTPGQVTRSWARRRYWAYRLALAVEQAGH